MLGVGDPRIARQWGNKWTISAPLTLLEEDPQQQQRRWPPPPPWERRPEPSITKYAAHRTVNYTAAPAVGDAITVSYTVQMATDEKVDDKPIESQTGQGSFIFDTKIGALRSLSAKLTSEVNLKNVTVKIPTTVELAMLSPDEFAKLKADADAEAAKQEEANKQFQARMKAEHANEIRELPAGAGKTTMVGGRGGSEFMKASPQHLPVIGFRIRIGGWGGHKVIGHVEPLYEKPEDLHPEGDTIVLARDGYAVGGAWLNGTDNANALRVIFMKKTATGVDPKMAYVSPWYGELQGPSRVKLGCNGQAVLGTFGRQGMNTDAFGLIMGQPDPTDDPNYKGTGAADPTDDPNFAGTPNPPRHGRR